jgi:cytochrome c peroxidase
MRPFTSLALGLAAFLIDSGSIATIAVAPGVSDPPLGLDLYRPIPPDNPLTLDKITLGRRLFRDRRLSRDGTIACATCHDPSRAFTDGRIVAVGVGGRAGRRNVPTIINRVYGVSFFWDGRAASLEQQVVQPLVNPSEMAASPDAVVSKVRGDATYRRLFTGVFGREPQWDDLVRALATYVRSILAGNSRHDRFQRGTTSALTAEEQHGRRLFLGRANCWLCHAGPNFTDERFHNTGVAFRHGQVLDLGRLVVTGRDEERGAFKTPTLREIARTAPYMHDGSLATLDVVIDFYDRGGNKNPGLDREMQPLRLSTAEKRALVAFLRALSGDVHEGR